MKEKVSAAFAELDFELIPMDNFGFKLEFRDNLVILRDHPELDGREGILIGNDMAFFYGKGRKNYELYIVNILTGQKRQLSTSSGDLLVEDRDIDYATIERTCAHGICNAKNKLIRYGKLGRWSNFEEGICAISWTLHPDGRSLADVEWYDMYVNEEETVYAVIDTNLDIIKPFRPLKDIDKYLDEIRKTNREITTRKKEQLVLQTRITEQQKQLTDREHAERQAKEECTRLRKILAEKESSLITVEKLKRESLKKYRI